MSTKAEPCEKKTRSVSQIALGRDQKNGSIARVSAAISQAARMATTMPTCIAKMCEVGQTFVTGRRRAGRLGRLLWALGAGTKPHRVRDRVNVEGRGTITVSSFK